MPDTFPHGYAMLVGVGQTAHAPWSLPVTVKDTRALQAVLVDPGLCAYPANADHVCLLTDGAATRAAILDGLEWLAGRAAADPEATVVVYFSGHGWVDWATDEYYLIPHDARPDGAPASFLPAGQFTAGLRKIADRRLLVLIDSCHAQGMATAKGAPAELPDGFAQAAPAAEVLAALKQGEGRAVFTSSRGSQRSWVRPDGALSLYTYHLIEALHGAGNQPGDTVVRLSNLMNHLGEAVPASAETLCQAKQTPFFDAATEDFAVAVLRGGKGLPAGGWDAVQPEAAATFQRLYQAVVSGSGAAAQGEGAKAGGAGAVVAEHIGGPVATGGGIAAAGDVFVFHEPAEPAAESPTAADVGEGMAAAGDMMTELSQLAGSILGFDLAGATAESIEDAWREETQPRRGTPTSPGDLPGEVAVLRAQVQRAVAASEIAAAGDAEDLEEALADAAAELAQPEPNGQRVVRKLETAVEILAPLAEEAKAAGAVDRMVVLLAPAAKALWEAAQRVFEGG
ncbi:MAG: caspase family protein [Anaerolineae bacterium]|nr:caspase family protein [Anaerolineae bacterium]